MTILDYCYKERKSDADNRSSVVVAKPLPEAWGRPIPGEEHTSPKHVYEASCQLVDAGLSVIPIEAYLGEKSPDTTRLPRYKQDGCWRSSWDIFQVRRAYPEELLGWRERGGQYGLAVIGGFVSGGGNRCGLEIIDFDTADLADPWMKAVEEQAPGLLKLLVRIRTPRPGMHVYYRCLEFEGSQQLACGYEIDSFGQRVLNSQGRPIRKTLIETKGEGGYCLIPPSPPRCHPSCRLYQYVEGSPDLTAVPTITPEERNILLNAARTLNQWREERPIFRPAKKVKKAGAGLLPGEEFDMRANWAEILEPAGWTLVAHYGEEERWCRPGKSGEVSASINHQGNGLLHVFSTNADPLEEGQSYTRFSAYTYLNHGGDFTKASKALRKEGFGQQELAHDRRTLVTREQTPKIRGQQ